MTISRRRFIQITAGLATASALGFPHFSRAAKKQVVVIGGGAGGATAAKYLAKLDSSIEVTLIESNEFYYTCFLSNEILSGDRNLRALCFNYSKLSKHGIKVIQATAEQIDPVAKQVILEGGDKLIYDRLVVSPGIDYRYEAIPGYSQAIAEKIPHAWKAGHQTIILRKQLEIMENGGVIIIAPPADPYRCPPAPYERASLIAQYLKQRKPKSKILIFDAKEKFSKQDLFMEAWKELYGYGTDNSLIEWLPPSEQGKVVRLDADNNTVYAGDFEDAHKADVINLIPPQKAGKIAVDAGLTDKSGWCPVNKKSFESTLYKDIYVIGDACNAKDMPKSGYAANSQAKICVAAILDSFAGKEPGTPSYYVNTCYSVVGKEYGISVAGIYHLEGDMIKLVPNSGGVSPLNASPEYRKREVDYAYGWFANVTEDMFG